MWIPQILKTEEVKSSERPPQFGKAQEVFGEVKPSD